MNPTNVDKSEGGDENEEKIEVGAIWRAFHRATGGDLLHSVI